ncbi:hypothetical protein AAA63_004424 [Salmonella enterica subsp. enterica]|nr:hypothetical protein [Salmonella enterica subsp. enterica serovar Poona]
MRKVRLHPNYGGLCGGGVIRAGSSLCPVRLTLHGSPPIRLASDVVILPLTETSQ